MEKKNRGERNEREIEKIKKARQERELHHASNFPISNIKDINKLDSLLFFFVVVVVVVVLRNIMSV
jgi:hypothetical protein